jgi:hypothetical protein
MSSLFLLSHAVILVVSSTAKHYYELRSFSLLLTASSTLKIAVQVDLQYHIVSMRLSFSLMGLALLLQAKNCSAYRFFNVHTRLLAGAISAVGGEADFSLIQEHTSMTAFPS